jgi:cardiolipin synthase
MNLHQASTRPDWVNTPKVKYNYWQRLAVATRGILTPANVISFGGLCVALFGLWLVTAGAIWQGTALVCVGRLADILDGVVADRTQTKSPLGEALDASFDKICSLAALVVFAAEGILPVWVALLIAVQNVTNVCIALIARTRRITLHPVRLGKLSVASFWASVALFVIAYLLGLHHQYVWRDAVLVLSYVLVGVALVLGTRATAVYLAIIQSPRPAKSRQ